MPAFDQTYFDPATKVHVHCDGRECWAEVTREVDRRTKLELMLEFLLQPRDERGLPIGPAMVLHREPFRFDFNGREKRVSGWSWLPPRLTPELLRRCHLRIRLGKLAAEPKENSSTNDSA